MNKLLVFGASGLVGKYLMQLSNQKNIPVIGTYCNNPAPGLVHFDLSNPSFKILSSDKFDYAVICSAVTKLEKCGQDPDYSSKVNISGIEKLIEQLDLNKIFPIFMSSAAVFDGEKGSYKEEDIRNPISLYGLQKLIIEDFITSNLKDYLIMRPGKIFGTNFNEGVLFTSWLEKYSKGEKIKCADDEKLSPCYAEDIARAVMSLINHKKSGIYHVNPNLSLSRWKMANDFFSYLGISDFVIERCSIDDFGFSEKRMKKSFLDASKFIESTGFRFTSLSECYALIKEKYHSKT